jgi:hypothetical protein
MRAALGALEAGERAGIAPVRRPELKTKVSRRKTRDWSFFDGFVALMQLYWLLQNQNLCYILQLCEKCAYVARGW